MQIALTIGQRIVRAPLAIALAGFLACGTAFAQPAQQVSSTQTATAADQNSVKLVKLLMALPAGSPWMSMKVGGLICIGNPTVQTWSGGREEQKISPYSIPFKTEL